MALALSISVWVSALIKDPEFFLWIESNAGALVDRDIDTMNYLVKRCAELHMQHIAGKDPFESGSSRPLDFGHWSAHKLEQLSNFEVLHGEAVAMGMAGGVLVMMVMLPDSVSEACISASSTMALPSP